MTDIQLYEFKILKRRFNRLTALSKCLKAATTICTAISTLCILNAIFYVSIPWAICSWIALLAATLDIFYQPNIAEKLSNCEYKIKKQKIMDSIPTEWTEIRFLRSNLLDNHLRDRHIKKALIKKQNDRSINLKCVYSDDTSDLFKDFPLETLMKMFDLSTFLD